MLRRQFTRLCCLFSLGGVAPSRVKHVRTTDEGILPRMRHASNMTTLNADANVRRYPKEYMLKKAPKAVRNSTLCPASDAADAPRNRDMAVCVTGYVRTGDWTHLVNLVSKLRSHNHGVDVFLALREGLERHSGSFTAKASLYKVDTSSRSFRGAMRELHPKWIEFFKSSNLSTGVPVCWHQWRDFGKCAQAVLQAEKDRGCPYSRLIKTRQDLTFQAQTARMLDNTYTGAVCGRGPARPALISLKDDRLMLFFHGALKRLARMYEEVVASGVRGTCNALVSSFAKNRSVCLRTSTSLTFVLRPPEAQFSLHFENTRNKHIVRAGKLDGSVLFRENETNNMLHFFANVREWRALNGSFVEFVRERRFYGRLLPHEQRQEIFCDKFRCNTTYVETIKLRFIPRTLGLSSNATLDAPHSSFVLQALDPSVFVEFSPIMSNEILTTANSTMFIDQHDHHRMFVVVTTKNGTLHGAEGMIE